MIRLFFAALLPSLLAVIMLPALAQSSRPVQERQPPAPAAAVTVNINASSFQDASVTIKPGETVAWVNASDRDHQIISDDQQFKSGTIKPGKSWSFKFEKAGTFRYHCALHPRAKGTVKVEQ